MVNKAEARVRLGVDDKALTEGLKDAAKQLGAFAVGANQTLELFKKVGGFVTGIFGGLADAVADVTHASEESIQAERGLASAMQLRGQFTKEALDAAKAHAEQIQRTTTLDGEYVLGLKEQLTLLGVHKKDLNDATVAVIGATEARIGESKALKSVAQLYRGEIPDGLKKFGLAGKDTAKTIEILKGNFSLAEAKANSFAGRMTQLANAWGDLKENIGAIITRSTAVQEILKSFTDFLGVGANLDLSSLALIFDKFVRGLAGVVVTVIGAMRGLIDFVKTDLKTLIEELSKPADQRSKEFIGGTLKGIGGFIADPFGIGAEAQRRIRSQQAAQTGERVPINSGGGQDPLDDLTDALIQIRDGAAGIQDILAGIENGKSGKPLDAKKPEPIKTTGAIGTRKSGAELPAEFSSLFGDLSPEDLRTLYDDYAKIEAEAAAKRDELLRTHLTETLDSGQIEIQSLKDVLELRKEIYADEGLTEEQRFGLLKELRDKEIQLEETAAEQKAQIAEQIASVAAQSITNLVESAVAGEESFGTVIKRMLGGLLETVGSSLIGMGTAAIAGGLIGSVAPWLAPETGGEAAIAAGAAAVIAGAGLVAAGATLSAGGRSHVSSPAASGVGSSAPPPRPTPSFGSLAGGSGTGSIAFQRPLDRNDRPVIYKVQIGSGPPILGGDAARVTRDVENFLNKGRRQLGLEPRL